ncbi:uncharacterized protein EDB91DRAFT_1105212 [Suillus paluster]|uniref:uncharacterized protein n=1 Tax=Suillus paluster TaxID=48578 RepID=UPI001B86EEB4|nr:uncharacterized protein EDB91DRAFT_1105212 [Suillus paluster]KAG1751388.1 hypothetical protein EDB91DRAFT_1105212 [Suillus paluster]
MSLGLHIVDPRILSDQVDLPSVMVTSLSAPPRCLSSRPSTMSSNSTSSSSADNLYSNLATFSFGEPRTSASSSSYDSDDEALPISPLTPVNKNWVLGRPASNPFPSSSRTSTSIRSRGTEHTDEESSEVPSSPDLIPEAQRESAHIRSYRSPILYRVNYLLSFSSRASFRSELSSDEEVEIASYDGGSSPVTFARDLDNIDENSPVFHRSFFEPRRGSLPMAIPGATSDAVSNRSREDSIHTIRRPSRSLDDDLNFSHSEDDPAAVVPRSDPLTRADFRSLVEAQTVQPQQEPDTFAGIDLSYVFSGKSEGSIRSFRSSAQLSFLAARTSSTGEPSSFRPPSSWLSGPRRPSAGTLPSNSGEDTFLNLIVQYETTNHWIFSKEKADAQPVSTTSSVRYSRPSINTAIPINMEKAKRTMFPGAQEIWRSDHVGRYRVDRLVFKPSTADPAKAPQQRINVRHIPDPFLKGPKTGGPSSVIHKHSRATAFSIFRSYSLFQPKRGGTSGQSGSRNIHMHTSGGIMLAPKKVQEQYTSTRTTSKLSTHGLLEEGSRKAGGNGDKSRRALLEKEKRREKEKEEAKKAKAKAKEKKKEKKNERGSNPAESTESSTTTSSAGSVNPAHLISAPARATTSKITFAPSTMSKSQGKLLQSTSEPSSPEASDLPSKRPLESDSSTSVASNRIHRDSIDSDEHLPTRTPHAEAFGTLDPNDIEHLRRAQKPSDGSSSLANRILRRLRGASSRPDSTALPAVTPQNAYSPPWIVTAGRDQNEEHVRVLTDLNNSFRDVGLLHTQPHKPGSKSSAKKRATTHDIFNYVPEDSLYMLLPLWAGETDPSMNPPASSGDAATTLPTIPEARQYLLVWYVPFEDKGRPDHSAKKKPKQASPPPEATAETNQKSVYLSNFRVNARLVAYDNLRGTGIRVPSDGLAITAPAWEANNLPIIDTQSESESESQIEEEDVQPKQTVICVCDNREHGFRFLPDGLTELGLCLKEEVPLPAADNPRAIYLGHEVSDVRQHLTPVGRAAVEMVWLGCLAVTSFGPYV